MTTLGLIGTGRWGTQYIRTIREIADCNLPDANIKTSNYRELFTTSGIDGIIIASPSETHYAIAKDCILHSIPVLVEKPFTVSLQQARTLRDLAIRKRVSVMIGHIYLYHPAIRMTKKKIPLLGQLRYISSESVNYGPIRKDVNALWDWGSHEVSIAMYLTGQKPVSVSAWGINVLQSKPHWNDMCYLRMTFNTGLVMVSKMGWLAPMKRREMTIVGDKASLIFHDTDHTLTLVSQKKGLLHRLPIPFQQTMPLANQVHEFVDSLKKRKPPFTSLQDGIDVVAVLEKSDMSTRRNGKTLKITYTV